MVGGAEAGGASGSLFLSLQSSHVGFLTAPWSLGSETFCTAPGFSQSE